MPFSALDFNLPPVPTSWVQWSPPEASLTIAQTLRPSFQAFGTGQDPSRASGPSVKLGFTERRPSPRQPLHGSYLGTGKEWAPLLLGTTVLDLLLPDRQMSIFTQSGNHRKARDPPKPSLLFRPLQGRLCLQ